MGRGILLEDKTLIMSLSVLRSKIKEEIRILRIIHSTQAAPYSAKNT